MTMAAKLSLSAIKAWPAEKKWLAVSAFVSCLLIWMSKSAWGDLLSSYGDHLHHSLATWVFLHLGMDAYRLPLGVSSTMVTFPPGGAMWPEFPVAYPPGMFVVFLPLSLYGAFVPVTTPVFAKIAIVYLTAIMHATLWKMTALVRRVESKAWLVILVFTWIYLLRVSLLGFYDGAWLLAAAFGVEALADQKHGRAVIFFVIALLISYRGVCLAPLGFAALWGMLKGPLPTPRKIGVVAFGVAGTVVTLGAFYMLFKYGPVGDAQAKGVGSSLLPLSFRPYVILAFGLATAAYVGWAASPLVGSMVGLASALSIAHGGHVWHGCILVPSLLTLTASKKAPLAAQIALGVWFMFFLEAAFDYQPFRFVEELIKFVEYNGQYPK